MPASTPGLSPRLRTFARTYSDPPTTSTRVIPRRAAAPLRLRRGRCCFSFAPSAPSLPLGVASRTPVRVPDFTTAELRGAARWAMPASEVRYGVAQVTEEALAGWNAFVDRHDIDRNVLAEVMGRHLGDLASLRAPLRDWVEEAKALKRQRRRRGPTS